MSTTSGGRSSGSRIIPASMKSLGFQQLTGITTSTGLTVPDGAEMALIQAETQSARFRDDGVAPTATVGMLLVAGGQPMVFSGNLAALRFINAVAGTIVNVSFYG